jgi:signal transduction histidine kinase
VVDGEPREIAPAVELSAYRIAQEALTNSLEHAPGSRACLRVHYASDALDVEVTDDGPGSPFAAPGHGLIGMRERVELFGGTFTAGARPDGGFTVRAQFPLAPVTS